MTLWFMSNNIKLIRVVDAKSEKCMSKTEILLEVD